MDYLIEQLGPDRFQELIQSLLLTEHPGLQCLSVGQADGGRDAYLRGDRRPTDLAIFQVKFTRRASERDPVRWLTAAVHGELQKIEELKERGANRYFLATNVPGTAALDVGTVDRLDASLSELTGLPSQCWWREDVNRRLDLHADLRWVYPELLRAGDLLRLLVELGLNEAKDRRLSAIAAFLAGAYGEDEEVRFKQVELKERLVDLFVDVPATIRVRPGSRAKKIKERVLLASLNPRRAQHFMLEELEEADSAGFSEAYALLQAENAAGGATLLLNPAIQKAMPLLVVEGAPGQGKSTLVQFVCQVQLDASAQQSTGSTPNRP